jgi:hypothetical protein
MVAVPAGPRETGAKAKVSCAVKDTGDGDEFLLRAAPVKLHNALFTRRLDIGQARVGIEQRMVDGRTVRLRASSRNYRRGANSE